MSDCLKFYRNMEDCLKQEEFSKDLRNLILNHGKKNKKIAFVCIGTNRAVGDSLAPFVGMFLKNNEGLRGKVEIYGTLHDPVHARNLISVLEDIDIENRLVIAIDACVANEKYLGTIAIHDGAICPGEGVGKDLPATGDISITGNIAISGYDTFRAICSTNLAMVYDMAKNIEKGISDALSLVYV